MSYLNSSHPYEQLKVELVKKYINLFPIYNLHTEIIKELEDKGVSVNGKKESLTNTLNNIFFRIKNNV